MKRTIFLAAIAAVAMVSCVKENSNVTSTETPIVLRGNAMGIEAKAVVNGGTAFSAQVVASKVSGDYTDAPAATFFSESVNFGASGASTVVAGKFYPSNDDRVYFTGYAPTAGTLTVATGVVAFTITGQEDVMYAAEVYGKRSTAATPPAMSFEHLLTQIKVNIVGDASAVSTWGSITSIEVLNQPAKFTLNLADGDFANASTLPADSAAFVVGSVAKALTTSSTTYGLPVMLEPIADLDTTPLYLLVKTATNTAGVEVPLKALGDSTTILEASKAYLITLTFRGAEIVLSGTVAPWTPGASTDIDVQ